MASWSVPLERLAEQTGVRLHDVVRQVTIELFSRVVLRSPVDTGRFRANWNISYNVIDDSTKHNNTNTYMTGERKLSEVTRAVLASPVGGIMYMCNSLPYARVLEYGEYPDPPKFGSIKRGETEMTIHTVNGYSMQAPTGMVRISGAEISSAVARALAT